MISRLLLVLVALVAPLSALAQVTKPPINAVAGPTTSAQLQSIIPDSTGSGPLNFGPSAAASVAIGIPLTGGTPNGLLFNDANTLGNLATAANGILATNGSGVPAIVNSLDLVNTIGPASATSNSIVTNMTSSGSADSTGLLNQFIATGAGSISQIRTTHSPMEVRTDPGTLTTTAEGYETYVRLGLANSSVGDLTAARPFAGHIANESGNAANIDRAYVYTALGPDFGDDLIPIATGTFNTVGGLLVTNQGHADRILTAAYGVKVNNMTPGAPRSSAFATDMDIGGDRYAFDSLGQAPSVHVGAFRQGSATDPTVPGFDALYSKVTLDPGATRVHQFVGSIANGDAGGSSQLNVFLSRIVSVGTNNLTLLNPTLTQVDISNTGGTITAVQGIQSVLNFTSASGTLALINGSAFRSNVNVTPVGGTTTITNLRGFAAAMAVTGTGGTTDATFGFQVEDIDFSSGTHTINVSRGLYIGGIGHATRTASVFGIDFSDFTAGTNTTAGIRSQLTSAATKYFILGSGSAVSAFAGNVGVGSTAQTTATLGVTSASATAFVVGRAGTITPAFQVDSSTGLQAAGLKITGAVAGGTVAIVAIDSNSATNITFNAKGSGTLGFGTVSTGDISIGNASVGTMTLTATTINFAGTTSIAVTSITSASATAFTVGLNGASNPSFQVDDSTPSQAAGLKLTGAVAAGTVDFSVISSGSNANVTFSAKGTGTMGIGAGSTGRVTITPVTTITGALTLSAVGLVYDGKTLTGSTGTGNMVLSASPTLTGTITAAAANFSGAVSVTSSSATSFTVGLNGATNSVLQVDSSTGSQVAGLKLTGAVTGGTVALAVIDSGSNANLSIDAKGTGTITVAGTSTGAITLTRATTLSAALTYGGVTLSNAVTGTGNMVLSASPTLSGTVAGTLTFSGALTLSSALTYGGVTLSNAVTGTGNMVLSAGPTLTGTLTAAAANFSGAVSITSSSATSFTVGLNGATNPVLQVDSSTGSQASGLKITGGVSAGALLLDVISSGTNNDLTVNAKGTGNIKLGTTSTGAVQITPSLQVSAAVIVTSAASNSIAIGPSGNTNPIFVVDSSTASAVAGLKITGAATGGTVAMVIQDSGSNASLTLNAKGTGTVGIGTVSTGVITLGAAVTLSNATLTFTNLATDATHTTRTVCQDTTSKILFFGSGAAGICLGTSSARFKTNILPETTGLAQIAQLNPVHFSYLKGYGDDGARVQKGFLAEEVAGVMPELVGYDEQGRPNTVDWAGMVPVLVNAVKELKASNDNLRVEVEALKRASR